MLTPSPLALVIVIVGDDVRRAARRSAVRGGSGGEAISVMDLPQLKGRPMVTDGGMETDLIFHHGVDLPLFAAFPLVDSPAGRSLLTGYYDEYAAIARRA